MKVHCGPQARGNHKAKTRVSLATENLKEVAAEPRNTAQANPMADGVDYRASNRDVRYLGNPISGTGWLRGNVT
ncbi:MAG: hypothetical protein QGI09_05880 [Dehalococcoidia bacterium]|nr:hypothetical protein [Dehalococcoidia bacterium]